MDRYTVTRCSEVVHSIWRETEREIVTECPSDLFTTVDFMMFIDSAEMAIRKF
jgi:hypothetical protein